ncbi:GNAT family N-acetyltransferase [Elstera litoralis]
MSATRFLAALEESGSVSLRTGWVPRHLVAESSDGRIVGLVPLYLKGHSWGEYVFDQGWADAFQRAGGSYYPKLQGGVPFTPVPGPRLLVAPDAPMETRQKLAEALAEIGTRLGLSSVHVTFAEDADMDALTAAGFLERHGYQFHWQNRGYGNFDDFLGELASRKRKAIRKERESVAASGLAIHTRVGGDIQARHWDAFYDFYLATVDKRWGSAYLTRPFFDRIAETLAERVVLIVAEDGRGTPVAGALNLRGADTLYGRNWGAIVDVPFLHFELCYYRALDYAIAEGLPKVEAGAQGEHKLQRGYLPTRTRSAHWIANPSFRRAVANFLEQERPAIAEQMVALLPLSPFKRSGEA